MNESSLTIDWLAMRELILCEILNIIGSMNVCSPYFVTGHIYKYCLLFMFWWINISK